MPWIDDPEVYRAALDNLPTGVYLVDRSGKILFWNAAAERITGYLRQDVVGHLSEEGLLGHMDGDDNEMTGKASPLAGALRNGTATDAQVSLRRKSGHRVLVKLHAAPIRNGHGVFVGAVESFEEIVPTFDMEQRQSKLAAYGCLDQASGVLNHGMVQSHLRETLATFAEHPVPFSILCIGIDGLESIKTRHGTGALAAVIRVVGQTLENSLRPTDFLGRWLENEFIGVLTECSADEVVSAGERLRKMVSQSKIEWWGDFLEVTISIGATSARTGDVVDAMVARAEGGLRESLARGGNNLVVQNK
jgi:diguanylate cyclase (GGDEF)-like protein/PAS domain S-box-containing protein